MAKALWWKRDFTQLFSTQQLFHSAFQHKKKTTNLCFPLGLMEHLSDKPDHQVSHNCHLVPHCIYFCFIMFYLLLWKLPPPIYSILASEERQETRKGLNISVFSNPFLLLPLWLLFFFFTSPFSCPFSQYFKYIFPDGVDTVIVKVNSDMNFPCSVMSVQDIQVQLLPPPHPL